MSRAVLILYGNAEKQTAMEWIKQAPPMCRLELRRNVRTLPQNDKLWAHLTDVSRQVVWYGEKLTPEDWKDVFTASLRNARVVPGLDARSFVPLGMRTSRMTRQEMSDLLELIHAFAAERGVKLGRGEEDEK